MNDYYVYIYLDPRKSGQYKYENYCFLYEPFYVGKGKGRRWKRNCGRNKYFIRKYHKIIELELKPIILKIYKDISEDKSFKFEKQLINEIGRINLKNGPLLNFTDGGEGMSGFNHSDETKRKLSNKNNGRKNGMFGKKHSKETKIKISINRSKNSYGKNNHFYGKHHSEKSKELMKKKMIGKYSGEMNPKSTLKISDAIEIKKILKSDDYVSKKITQKIIADKYNVTISTISSIKNGRTWSNI